MKDQRSFVVVVGFFKDNQSGPLERGFKDPPTLSKNHLRKPCICMGLNFIRRQSIMMASTYLSERFWSWTLININQLINLHFERDSIMNSASLMVLYSIENSNYLVTLFLLIKVGSL